MKIHIEDNLYIESDIHEFTIKTVTGSRYDEKLKRDVEVTTTNGHFVTLEAAVRRLIRMKVHESTAATLGELLEDIARIETYIQSKIAV